MPASSRSRPFGTAPSPTSVDPPSDARSISSSTCRSTPTAFATRRAASIPIACTWPYGTGTAWTVQSCAFALAATVAESSPPERSTAARVSYAAGRRRPDEFVQLELDAYGQFVGQHPLGEQARLEHAVRGREVHRLHTCRQIVF